MPIHLLRSLDLILYVNGLDLKGLKEDEEGERGVPNMNAMLPVIIFWGSSFALDA